MLRPVPLLKCGNLDYIGRKRPPLNAWCVHRYRVRSGCRRLCPALSVLGPPSSARSDADDGDHVGVRRALGGVQHTRECELLSMGDLTSSQHPRDPNDDSLYRVAEVVADDADQLLLD